MNRLNRLFCIVLGCIAFTISSATSSLAIPAIPGFEGSSTTGFATYSDEGEATYIGGIVNGIVYVGVQEATNQTVEGVFDNKWHNDSLFNVNVILDYYNDENNEYDYIDQLYEYNKNDDITDPNILSDDIPLTDGTQFVSIKWDGKDGGWFLWNVAGLSSFSFAGLSHGLSHYVEYTAAPVPEPATALLLLAGLLGFGAYRKKYRA